MERAEWSAADGPRLSTGSPLNSLSPQYTQRLAPSCPKSGGLIVLFSSQHQVTAQVCDVAQLRVPQTANSSGSTQCEIEIMQAEKSSDSTSVTA